MGEQSEAVLSVKTRASALRVAIGAWKPYILTATYRSCKVTLFLSKKLRLDLKDARTLFEE